MQVTVLVSSGHLATSLRMSGSNDLRIDLIRSVRLLPHRVGRGRTRRNEGPADLGRPNLWTPERWKHLKRTYPYW